MKRVQITAQRNGTNHIDFYINYQLPRILWFLKGKEIYVGHLYSSNIRDHAMFEEGQLEELQRYNYSFYLKFV